ncbi:MULTISPECIES: Crp/Fnr family transcriptional regulator [Chitinophagaceae]
MHFTLTFSKRSFILKEDRLCHHLFYIKSGLVKIFSCKSDSEFVMKFFNENMLFIELQSYFTRQPSRYIVLALEDTLAFAISSGGVRNLSNRHRSISIFLTKYFK